MKTIKHLHLLILMLLSTLAFSQNNMEDVVYLKNGSIIRGIIVEQIPNQSIKIQTTDRNIFVFKFDEIQKMTKEKLMDMPKNTTKNKELNNTRYLCVLESYYSLPIGDVKNENISSISQNLDYISAFKITNGYKIIEQFALGLGVGVEKHDNTTNLIPYYNYIDSYYKNTNLSFILLPISLEIRSTPLNANISPTINFNIGYGIGVNGVKAGGLIVNPSIGVKKSITKNMAFLFNIGYKWQTIEQYTLGKFNYQFITISTGFSF